MKSYSSKEIITMLHRDGWFYIGAVGDHYQFRHPTKKGRVTVTHPQKDMPNWNSTRHIQTSGLVATKVMLTGGKSHV